MRRGNKKTGEELVGRLEEILTLLTETITVAKDRLGKVPDSSNRTVSSKSLRDNRQIDFSIPIRPFVKRYGTGLSGPKKFALLLAYLAQGDCNKRVVLEEVERHWNRMTAKSLLGMRFNRFYAGKAKENDWVHTEKPGEYHLRPSWKSILDEER